MADPTKVYQGGLPTGGFGTNLSVSSEGENGSVPGGPANRPGTVNQGGSTQGKTYDKNASQDFLMDKTYKTDMEVAPRPTSTDVDNPDDISHADHNDDSDLPNK